MDWLDLHTRLAAPFALDAIFWRAGAVSRDKKRAQALPYAEPRIYEDRLNNVVGLDWSVTFKPWGENRIICELTIQGQTRSSTGEENDGFAPGTAAEAQAFKRACVKFGLGRYIYDIPISWMSYDAERRQLSEVPQLAAKFLPGKAAEMLEPLDGERVKKMRLELQRLGYEGEHVGRFVQSVLNKKAALESLTVGEATQVWQVALRNAKVSA